MFLLPRRLRRHFASLVVALFVLSNLWYIILPPDSAIRLAVQFNASRLANLIRETTSDRDAWLREPAAYPVDLKSDVGYLIKTGYGTNARVAGQMQALSRTGAMLMEDGKGFLVVADFESRDSSPGYHIHDAVKMVMETKVGKQLQNHPRFMKYRGMHHAIQLGIKVGEQDKGKAMSQEFGWELDALKFIMGMELAYERMPNRKWYAILDDDSFVIAPSLRLFLSHLDPTEPLYIGNAVGDYKGRFAHGGSGILVSGEAMRRLFARPDIVAQAFVTSLDETWGDRLVATTFQKLGIYIDERYNHHFNGEPPEFTQITADRFCSPLMSFHGLRKPGAMADTGDTLQNVDKPVLWGQLFETFRGYSTQELVNTPILQARDHVGPPIEGTKTWRRVETADACRGKCDGDGEWCMAWTHDSAKQECHTSPWMVIGRSAKENVMEGVDPASMASGVNRLKAEPLLRGCP